MRAHHRSHPTHTQWTPMGASPDTHASSLSRVFSSKLSLSSSLTGVSTDGFEDTEPMLPPDSAYGCSLEEMEHDTIRG